ncbi:MAG: retropepsin-like aspartic protease [Cyanobacteriota bacterium]|nr:retropepsin-like aspartic protease [Cyanobacteriota bacterium]
MKTNLKLLTGLAIFTSVSAFVILDGVSAIAQELPGCFMKDKAGRYVRLNTICQFPDIEFAPPSTASTTTSSGTPGVYLVPIIRREAGIPVIEVLFNENQTFEMLVDTGASATVITPAMAELLGVVPVGKGRADTPSQRDVEFDIGLVQSITISGARQLNLPVAIAPALNLGLLGQDFFSRYDVTIKEDVIEFRERS